MKTIKITTIIVIAMFFAIELAAQPPSMRMVRTKLLKGIENEYVCEVFEKDYKLRNSKNIFISKAPNYNTKIDESIPFVTIQIKSNDKLNARDSISTLTEKMFAEYIVKTKLDVNSKFNDEIFILLQSDLSGEIKDVTFSIPNCLVLPVEKVEQLEKELKKTFKLDFVVDHRNKGALYMGMFTTVPLQPIREKYAVQK